jgi:hypothetical protein
MKVAGAAPPKYGARVAVDVASSLRRVGAGGGEGRHHLA